MGQLVVVLRDGTRGPLWCDHVYDDVHACMAWKPRHHYLAPGQPNPAASAHDLTPIRRSHRRGHPNIVDSQSYDDDFVRRAVLVLMGTILAPQSTKFVPYRYYKMVEDVNAIKSYNWNDFALGVCMDAIKKSVEDLEKFKWPIGNLALLQVQVIWYKLYVHIIFM